MTVLGRTVLCVLAIGYFGRSHVQGAPNGDGTANTEAADTILSRTCGKRGDQIILVVFAGSNAYLGMYPWMAALGYERIVPGDSNTSPGSTKIWACAGSLVTDRHLITAAHCVDNTDLRLRVARLGDLDIDDSVDDGASPTDYEVDSWVPHPEYNAPNITDDIAVVKLKGSVTFTRHIQPICLPTSDEVSTRDFIGYPAYVAGWGRIRHDGPVATHLQEGRIVIVSNSACQEIFKYSSRVVIDDRVICAGGYGSDTCRGDSGGPLMVRHGSDFYLYGIVSFGYRCGVPGYPAVYTRVTEYMNWISSNLK